MTDTDTLLDSLKDAREFAQTTKQVEYLLVRNSDDSTELGELEIKRNVQNELRQVMTDEITRFVDAVRSGGTLLEELETANTFRDESILQYIPADELPPTDLFALLQNRSSYPHTTYSDGDDPDFQLIRVRDPNGKLLIGVQNYRGDQIIDTSTKATIWYNNKVYDKFSTDLVQVPQKINVLYYDGWVFIVSPKSFERMFEMRDAYEERAKEVLNEFSNQNIEFAREEQMEDWLLGNLNMLRKMYQVGELDMPAQATPQEFKRIIDKYNPPVDYTMKGGKIELDVEEYTDIWKILRVFTDSYSEGEILDVQWEIDQKRLNE